jgi:hypothetical protein
VSKLTDPNRSVLSGASRSTASPSGQSANTSPRPEKPHTILPSHKSGWSAFFFLPGDATVIGLLYVTQVLEINNLRRELHYLSHHSNMLALGLLAGFWWLVITRGLVGISASIIRFTKTVAKKTEQSNYG